MDNLHLFYINTNQYCNQLYQNKAEAYTAFKTYVLQLQEFLDLIEKDGYGEKDDLYQNYVQIIEAVLAAYQEQNVLRMADIIKGNLMPFVATYMQLKGEQLLEADQNSDVDGVDNEKAVSEVSDIWEKKNLAAIPENTKQFYHGIESYLAQIDRDDPSIMIDGNHSIAVEHDQSWWYVNSMVNSSYAAAQWVKAQDTIADNDILILCGLSNGDYIRELAKNVSKENIIIVYEPDPRIFAANFMYTDMSDILQMDHVFLLIEGINMKVQNTLLSSLINYYTIKYTKFFALPGYDVAYSEAIQGFMEKCNKTFEEIQLQNNTIIQKNKNVNYNVIMNLKFMMEGSDIDRLKQRFEAADVLDIPAIIVAAGPSLDKNIRELSAAKNKAFIIATDSSIRMLMKHQIMPDMIVTLDPDKERVLFEDDRVNDIPFIYSVHGTYDVLNHNRSKKFLLSNMNFINQMFTELGKEISTVDPGGSVANAGFAAARFLGFHKIIMIGQDLAFTDNKKHASVVYDESPIGSDSDMYTTIEGIHGEELLTYVNFKAYRDWYENIIEYDDALTFINATEGGAKIHGALQMTLKDAIAQYCTRNVEMAQLIEQCECTFSQNEKVAFIKKVDSYIKECEDVWRISRNLKHNYELMTTTNQPDKAEKLAHKSDALVEQLDQSAVMEFISYYARLDEMQVMQDLYDVTDTEEKNIWKELGHRGEQVAASYQKYAVQTKELFEKSYEQLCAIVGK